MMKRVFYKIKISQKTQKGNVRTVHTKMKHKKISIKISVMVLLIIIFFFAFSPAKTLPIKGANGKVLEQSVASLETIKIGGIDQTILIRGHNIDSPIILFLHGGPGYPMISYARHFQSKIEEKFIVVNWDQRGSGKSYSNDIPENSMNKEVFISDTHELVAYLSKRFDKEKIYLVGHSWGSEIGIKTVERYPQNFHAYIGVGQSVNSKLQEEISYEFAYNKALAQNNRTAIHQLKTIGYPPYDNHKKDVMIQRKWLMEFGGAERNVNTMKELIIGILFSYEYTWVDGIKFYQGNYFNRKTMFDSQKDVNLFVEVPKLNVPVCFCAGRYDYNTPSELVEQYYKQLEASKKKFIWFEESAHEPHLEEPDKFAQVLFEVLEEIEK